MFVQRLLSGVRAGVVLAAVALVGACGGSGGNSEGKADVRLVNATQTHATVALLEGSTTRIASVALDAASDYAGIGSGSPTLQVNDAATSTALGVISPSLSDGKNYAVVAYELGGSVKLGIMSEIQSEPSSGTAVVRVFNTALDAGALDVYVVAPGTDITTVTTSTFPVAATSTPSETSYVSFTPGTYQVVVTASGNASDVRLTIPSITLASKDVATILLTPTVGGTLVNGALMRQEGSYTASRNTNARVRLAAGTSPGSTVTASVGSTTIATLNATNVSNYVTVPAATAFNVSVNGASVASPAVLPVAGTDSTLFVHGTAGAATASVTTDDNRMPTASTNVKMRLANGTTGPAVPLSLTVDFSPVASNVAPGAISAGYTTIPSSGTMQFDVTPSLLGTQTRSVTVTGVYTLFIMGDASVPPVFRLIKDR